MTFTYNVTTKRSDHHFLSAVIFTIIKTYDNELRGQEEAAIICETKITQLLSKLFTRKTAKKIANALAKLP